MRNIRYYKTENEIEDMLVIYGLCRILKDSNLTYKFISKENHFLIIIEDDFKKEDLFLQELKEEFCWNINSNMNKSELSKQLEQANSYFDSELGKLNTILDDIEDEKILEKNNINALAIGSHFYTQSLRLQQAEKPLKIPEIIRHLSFLGFINSMNYYKNRNVEINALMISQKYVPIDEILKIDQRYTDKETGEQKLLTYLGKNTEIEIMAIMVLKASLQKQYLSDICEKIVFTQYNKAGNKPLPDKYYEVYIPKYSIELYEKFLKKISYSNENVDVKDATAKFIVFNRYRDFRNLIYVYSKQNEKIDIKHKEELMQTFNNKVQVIFNNGSIKKLGSRLNYLLYKKKGFQMLTKLYSVRNEKHLATVITDIIDNYKRYTERDKKIVKSLHALNQNELEEIINLVNDKEDARVCANAIIAYSRVFLDIPKNQEVKDEQEIEDDEEGTN